MSWTGYYATHYKDNGVIDRKAELDCELFRFEKEDGHKLVKSAMVGAVYYAAVQSPHGHVYGLVVITQTSRKTENGCNFWYRDMGESMEPFYYDCPPSILKLLSPTDNEGALSWRKKCKLKAEQKKAPTALANLPVGARIRFYYGDKLMELVKHAPAYQFKRPFWYNLSDGTYLSTRRIPSDYTVL